jgi:Arc-like DNA binding domain
MPDLLIEGIAPQHCRRLKNSARQRHRSMNAEILFILEGSLSTNVPAVPGIQPFKGSLRVIETWLEKIIYSGRV